MHQICKTFILIQANSIPLYTVEYIQLFVPFFTMLSTSSGSPSMSWLLVSYSFVSCFIVRPKKGSIDEQCHWHNFCKMEKYDPPQQTFWSCNSILTSRLSISFNVLGFVRHINGTDWCITVQTEIQSNPNHRITYTD